jgi:transposase
MARLENVSVEEVESALKDATGKWETKRLLLALIYKRGPPAPMIAEWLDTREQTIYRWFDRLESEPVEWAVRDRQRSGRPPKLDADHRDAFHTALRNPPTDAGYDETEWTPDLARRFLDEEFGVEYSCRHFQRLLNDPDLSG